MLGDVLLIWRNCRAFNPPRASIVRMLAPIEDTFRDAWANWVETEADSGWEEWLRCASRLLVAPPFGGKLPGFVLQKETSKITKVRKPASIPPPPPPMSEEEIAQLSFQERQSLLESALPGRAPPPPGWDASDVGGCPWHKKPQYMTKAAMRARARCEGAVRRILRDAGIVTGGKLDAASRAVVAAAVGIRVLTHTKDGAERYGTYLHNGKVRDEATKQELKLSEFAQTKIRPKHHIVLAVQPDISLEKLFDLHGSSKPLRDGRKQADPHCGCCGDGESLMDNEILLCDGLGCDRCYHQKCCSPQVEAVPEGAWLCHYCEGKGNIIDPQARLALRTLC
eukprot:2512221-Pleurochrysis_carterae.AAC.2